jgi:integrase
MVEAFRDELEGVLSRALARKVLESLKAIISEALRRGSVARNAALPTKVTAKKREKKPLEVGVDIPSKNEIKGILAAAQGRWRPFLTTAIFTGMRASELRGLTWSYVDLVKKTVHVGQRADRWGEMGAPKSNAGYRDIPLQPMALNALKEWRLACPKGELDLVFPNLSGKVEDHENISKRGFQPAQVAAGVVDADGRAKYGLHSLRHFFASYVIEQGFSPKRCQSLLGHSSITMTFDTYGHLFPNLEDDHAKLAEAERKLFA